MARVIRLIIATAVAPGPSRSNSSSQSGLARLVAVSHPFDLQLSYLIPIWFHSVSPPRSSGIEDRPKSVIIKGAGETREKPAPPDIAPGEGVTGSPVWERLPPGMHEGFSARNPLS